MRRDGLTFFLFDYHFKDDRVTIIDMLAPGIRIHGAGKYFQNICYWHSRELDEFVGIWDFDEMPLFNAGYFNRWSNNNTNMHDYLSNIIKNGSKLLTWEDQERLTNRTNRYNQETLTYINRPQSWPLPDRNVSSYSQFCMAGHAVKSNGVNLNERSGKLEVDFPKRTREWDYFDPPKHAKCIAISDTTNSIEIHKVGERKGVFNI